MGLAPTGKRRFARRTPIADMTLRSTQEFGRYWRGKNLASTTSSNFTRRFPRCDSSSKSRSDDPTHDGKAMGEGNRSDTRRVLDRVLSFIGSSSSWPVPQGESGMRPAYQS
jgi:hypothetical protein